MADKRSMPPTDGPGERLSPTTSSLSTKDFPGLTRMDVYGNADGERSLLGILSYDAAKTQSVFQWDEAAVARGVEWSSLNFPLSVAPWTSSCRETDTMGLPGLIHDALPDGWGVLLMNWALSERHPAVGSPSPLFRLAMLEDQCWGALEFSPGWSENEHRKQHVSLSELVLDIGRAETLRAGGFSRALLTSGSIAHGARPKIMVAINGEGSQAWVGNDQPPDGYRPVLLKFAGKGDDPSEPVLEYCYGESARALGIETAPACLVEAGSRTGLCLDRFDRVDGQKRHVHSMAGMLHTTHRVANSDWLMVADLLAHLKSEEAQFEQAFSRAVFNAVFCVRDDHTKNIAFLRHGKAWRLAPAFDLTYSEGPGGYHTLTYANHAQKNVGLSDLQRLAGAFGVAGNRVREILERAQDARTAMLKEAKGMAVPPRVLKAISKRFVEIDRGLAAAQVR